MSYPVPQTEITF